MTGERIAYIREADDGSWEIVAGPEVSGTTPDPVYETQIKEALPDYYGTIETIQPDADTGEPEDYDMGYTRFARYLARAQRESVRDLDRHGVTEGEAEDLVALDCYLIADYDIRRDKGWSNSSESDGGVVSFSRSQWRGDIVTEPRRNYEDLINQLSIEAGYGLTELGVLAADALVTHCAEEDLENVLLDSLEKSGYDPASFIDGEDDDE